MAVAGLRNISDFSPSFFGESQRSWDDGNGRPSTRASTLLRMWRELEGEHAVSQSYRSRQQRNGSDSECVSTTTSVENGSENGDDYSQVSDESENHGFSGSETEHMDNISTISEQSSDLGEIERGRVRRVFREWMNGGSKGHSSSGFRLNYRSGQWLGENECESEGSIRECAQMTAQPRSNCRSPKDTVAESGSQIEQVRDQLVITHPRIGSRRPIRRLCGRQTLLDLLHKAQNERKRELLSLSEQRPVSDFAYRNRIQALLRGRFLRNERLALDERPSSVASTELGLLRQRHTVSGLREGFLSKLDNSASTSVNSAESESFHGDGNNGKSESTTCREGEVTGIHTTSELESGANINSTCREGEVTGIHTASDLENSADVNRITQGLEVQLTEAKDPVLVNEGSEQEVLLGARSAGSGEEPALDTEAREHEFYTEVEYHGSRRGEQIDVNVTNEYVPESSNINYSGSQEEYNENYELRSCENYVFEVDGHTTDLEGNTNEEFDSHDASGQGEELQELQESVTETEDSAWQQLNTVAYTEWADGSREDTDRIWHERASSQSFPGPSGNNDEEQYQTQQSQDWPSHNLQEVIDSWLDMPSGEMGTPVGRLDTYYFPDDDNDQSMELRELFSRRRVSSLLRSSFRESLDQVLQSHAERLVHASDDWEQENTSFPALIEQNQEHLNGDQASTLSDSIERNPFAPSTSLFDASQPLWDEGLQDANWFHPNSNQQLETEWEIINDLRIDLARLQQRMNNMQNMLEACMDMQLELQRSVRQEVSAALNRSIFLRDTSEDNWIHDESQWDQVKKGICCLCRDGKIDSLLYRCGHMCACTKCAEKLVQSKGKCPMCRAPAVEAVRAYFIQQ